MSLKPIRDVLITIPRQIADSPTAPRQNLAFLLGIRDGFAARGVRASLVHVGVDEPDPMPGVDADLVLVYHGVFAKALPGRWTCKVGPLPDLFWLDPCGHARYALRRVLPGDHVGDPRVATLWAKALCRQLAKANASKYSQPAKRRLQRSDRMTLFVPLQMPEDQVLMGGPGVVEHLLLVVSAIARAAARGAVPILCLTKLHPKCSDDALQSLCARLHEANAITLVNESIHSILPVSDAVCCINSGVGLEAMLHGVPVWVTGASDYAPWAAARVASESHLADLLLAWQNPMRKGTQMPTGGPGTPDGEAIRRQYVYAHYLCTRLLVPYRRPEIAIRRMLGEAVS